MPDDADFLCGGWIWAPVHRELRFHTRTRKGWKDEPEQVERPRAVASVTWHRWSQAPMQTATGDVIPPSHSRVLVAHVRRGELPYEVKGPLETFTVWALVGVEEERLPVAAYQGYEGWADPEEWREFARELGRSLGVEVAGAGEPASGTL